MKCLCTNLVANPAFTAERLTDDLISALIKRNVLRKADRKQFQKLGPMISLYAISAMHGTVVILEDGSRPSSVP